MKNFGNVLRTTAILSNIGKDDAAILLLHAGLKELQKEHKGKWWDIFNQELVRKIKDKIKQIYEKNFKLQHPSIDSTKNRNRCYRKESFIYQSKHSAILERRKDSFFRPRRL